MAIFAKKKQSKHQAPAGQVSSRQMRSKGIARPSVDVQRTELASWNEDAMPSLQETAQRDAKPQLQAFAIVVLFVLALLAVLWGLIGAIRVLLGLG